MPVAQQLALCSYPSRFFSTQNEKRKPRNKQREAYKRLAILSPHILLGGIFILSANTHLLVLPIITGTMHWMFLTRQFSKLTLYYDLYKMENNEQLAATYEKIRETLLTDPQFSLFINQPKQPGMDSKDLIFENPIFQPYSYSLKGITGQIDEKRKRYQFECHFKDLSRDSEGKVQSKIIFDDKNEAYFESFTVFINRPVERTIRLAESDIQDKDENLKKYNQPRIIKRDQPQEAPHSKHRQY